LVLGILAILKARDLVDPRGDTKRKWRERVPMSVPFTRR
jgi:hypothetical protein